MLKVKHVLFLCMLVSIMLFGCATKPTATDIRDQAVQLQQDTIAFAAAAQPLANTAGQVAVAVEVASGHQDVQQLTELVTQTVNVANTIVAKQSIPTVDGDVVTGVAAPVTDTINKVSTAITKGKEITASGSAVSK